MGTQPRSIFITKVIFIYIGMDMKKRNGIEAEKVIVVGD
jgi:hypothetical protein